MASTTWWPLLGLAAATLACATLNVGPTAPETRPADFTVRYAWQEGSLPPPYHYSYTVSIAADGAGLVEYIPDYSFSDPPKWVETFTVTTDQLDALYTTLRSLDVFSTPWSETDDIPVGGSSSTLEVTASGTTYTVPAFPARAEADADAAKSAVSAMVPGEIWARLTAQRDQYVLEHQTP